MAGRDDERVAEPTVGAGGADDDCRRPLGAFDPPVVPLPAPPVAITGRRSLERRSGPPSGLDQRGSTDVGARTGDAADPRRPADRTRPGEQPPRPRIEDEPSILGLTRHSNSRLGARLFTLFFVLVYAVIVIQLVVALVGG